ncbi:MAG TPA: PqqD family protein [Bacteroidales bacterium]|nr:PqqD family protein [Bacteroidales bacterium]
MKIKSNIAISDNGFVFNPLTGESFTANPTGLEIINSMRRGVSSAQIIENLCSTFQVEPTQAERDLQDFTEMMRQYHLLSYDEE